MRAAVLLNPFAGNAGRIRDVADTIGAFLSDCEVFSADAYGGELLPGSRTIGIDGRLPYVERLHTAIDALSSEEPELYVVAGGDGMAAYVAGRLLATGHKKPQILGLAMGTANVGPIIAMSVDALAHMRPDQLTYRDVGAIEVYDGDGSAAFAFNDVVLGDTLLSTVGGHSCTVNARLLAESGKQQPAEPCVHIGPVTIDKNGVPLAHMLPRISQIIVSPVERENLYGRAVAGMLCFTAGRNERAAMLLTERPLVTLAPDQRGYTSFAACEQLLFSAQDRVRVSNLNADMLIITDGNPYIRKYDTVTFCYRPGMVRAAAR